MLWLILGIILLVIAIAGGAIVHPVIFVLGLLALFMAVSGWRGRAVCKRNQARIYEGASVWRLPLVKD